MSNKGTIGISLILIVFVLSSCDHDKSKPELTKNDSLFLGIIQDFSNRNKTTWDFQAKNGKYKGIFIFKYSIYDTTWLIINSTCGFNRLLHSGCLYSYLFEKTYVFANFKLFDMIKTCDFDSAAARTTTNYYDILKSKSWEILIDPNCDGEGLNIIIVKGKVILYEYSYGGWPDRHLFAIMMNPKNGKGRDLVKWYRDLVK